jgi:protein involved in polysaccharide export with SLBB domain
MTLKNLFLTLLALVFVTTHAPAQIQPGKAINITISNVPPEDKQTINGVYPVSDGGTINMPFIGPVQAAGMSSAALQSSLQARYKSAGIYTNPTIQVIVDANNAQVAQESVTVGGFVRRPGQVPFTRELTLWQAIQAGGGATEFGSMKRVRVLRDGKQREYDVTKPQFMNIPLQRNDTIQVPQKTILGG